MRPYGQFNKGIDARRNDTGLRRAEPGRPGRLGGRSLAGRVLTAVLLAAFAALMALPAQAQTTAITLVSNTHLTQTGNSIAFAAQSFETGTAAGGYTVSEVDVRLVDVSGRSTSVSIRENNASDEPGALVATLTNPDTLTANGLNTFTAPAGTTLAASRTYWISVNEGISSNRASVANMNHDGQTGEPGWSIGNSRLSRTNETADWSLSAFASVVIEIRGTSGGTTLSTDATLSGLALVDGDNNAITLDTIFASDDYEYEVSVVNGIDAVTLTATANDSNAIVAITGDTTTSTPDEAELDLSVGSNTLTVTVTAEDTTTALTYTVTVTREATTTTAITLVSNTHHAASSGASSTFQAQSFETGANAGGYTVSEVQVRLQTVSGKSTSVTIRENASDEPGALVATLTNPGTLTAGSPNTFTAPGGTTLAASTTYWISVNEGISSRASVGRAGSDGETGETGWSIGDGRLWRGAEGATPWTSSDTSLLIEIRGTSGGTTLSADATLSGLALEGATGGETIDLTPVFDAGTITYTASVANGIDAVTLSATKNDGNAMVAITGDTTTSTPDVAELSLNVGSNTLTVTVTAEDGTLKTYTITVTRAVPANLVVSVPSLTVGEAGSDTFTVKLATQPSASVTVGVTSDDTGAATASPASLTFTTGNWNTTKTVTVSGVNDSDTNGESVTVSLDASGGGYGSKTASVSVSVTDDDITTTTDVTLSGPYIRSILVPYDLDLGEKALPEEEITVWAGYPFYEDMYVVAEGDRWSPSGVWGDPVKDMIWVVDPIHFGIHALKLSALKDGRIERHIAANTNEFDYRFNYNCHFMRTRASGAHGNPALTVMWGDGSTIWVVNDESGQLDAYRRDGTLTSGCYTENVTAWMANGPTTAMENFKTPFTRDASRDYSLRTGGPLTVRGIWSDGTKIWVSGPPGNIYTIHMGTGHVVEAPGFDGHYDAYGLWSDGTTMWVATGGRLRAYYLNTGDRRAALDVRLRGNQAPGDMWSDGTTIWITYHSGSIEVYRLPERSGGVSQATEAEPLTASFASAPDGHDGESGFTFRIAFSEEVEITPEDMRDHALVVSGGTVTDAAGVDGRKDLWQLTVEPTSTGPVSISVLQGRACTETGALCTADGRSLTSSLALRVAGPPAAPVNSPATGRPTISGTAQVRETLTADTSDIGDADGLTNVTFSYQWLANDGTSDTDIAGETDSSYTLAASDEGKTIKVRVSFTDDAANEETLTSGATAEVAGEVTAGVRAEPPGAPRNLTGAANADGTVTLSWDAPKDDSVTGYQILRRRPREGEGTLLVHVNDTGSTATEYTDNDVTPDVLHAYRVKAISAVGLSRRSNFVNMTPALPAEPAQNSPATGRPAISGTAQVGETLTADTTGIGDADGLTNVAFSYQWLANDGPRTRIYKMRQAPHIRWSPTTRAKRSKCV